LDENSAIGYLIACFCPLPPLDRPGISAAQASQPRLHEIEQTFGIAWVSPPPTARPIRFCTYSTEVSLELE
jgi:hypothetical protein